MDAPSVATVAVLLWAAAQARSRHDEKPKTDAEKLTAYYSKRRKGGRRR